MKTNAIFKINSIFFVVATILILALATGCSTNKNNSGPYSGNFDQQLFETPQELVAAITLAVNSHDSNALLKILGPKGRDLVFSGDPVSDKLEMDNLAKRLAERSELIPYVSGEFPNVSVMKLRLGTMGINAGIPIINEGKGWRLASGYFAPRSVKRRIATNEIEVWRACIDYVQAQRKYFQKDHDNDGVLEYAQNILSNPTKKDGLYWSAQVNQEQSPLSKLVAEASAKGFNAGTVSNPKPYHGYIFKILDSQGNAAKDGKRDYIVDGNMTKGFALVASPVEWSVSGLRTFVVGPDALIYGKNLGVSTDRLVEQMTELNPDRTWHWIQQPQLEEFELYMDSL